MPHNPPEKRIPSWIWRVVVVHTLVVVLAAISMWNSAWTEIGPPLALFLSMIDYPALPLLATMISSVVEFPLKHILPYFLFLSLVFGSIYWVGIVWFVRRIIRWRNRVCGGDTV